ncbi:hypothetical protein JCM5353_000331 [Sporobolomyces roseus]
MKGLVHQAENQLKAFEQEQRSQLFTGSRRRKWSASDDEDKGIERSVEEEEEGESDSDDDSGVAVAASSWTKEDLKRDFPSAHNVQEQVAKLRLSTVQLPLSERIFDTARELLIILYAYSQQRNYTVRRCDPNTKTAASSRTLIMECSQSRHKDASGKGCSFQVRAYKTADEKWSSTTVLGFHNHDVLQIDTNQGQGNPDVKVEDTFNAAGPSQTTLGPHNPFSLPEWSSSFPPQPLPIVSLPPLPLLSPSNILQSSSSSTPISRTYPSDLVAFLRSFFPSYEPFSHLLGTLQRSGVDSLDTLIELMATESSSLEKYVQMLQEEEVGKMVVKMAQELGTIIT